MNSVEFRRHIKRTFQKLSTVDFPRIYLECYDVALCAKVRYKVFDAARGALTAASFNSLIGIPIVLVMFAGEGVQGFGYAVQSIARFVVFAGERLRNY